MSDDPDRVLARLRPSPPRRVAAIGTFACLGVLLMWLGVNAQGGIIARVLFVGMGAAVIYLADVIRRSTDDGLELTRSELRTEKGVVLARIEDIEKVDRGTFAFKPSNGFLIRLKTRGSGGWVPGIWWRRGRYVGVGGVVPGGQAKAMAEIMTALVLGIGPDSLKAP